MFTTTTGTDDDETTLAVGSDATVLATLPTGNDAATFATLTTPLLYWRLVPGQSQQQSRLLLPVKGHSKWLEW